MKPPISTMTVLFLAGLGAALPALAQVEPPHRKPGMWEQSLELSGGKSMTMQMCIDEETERQYSAMGRNRPGCTHEFHKIPGGYSFKGTCDGKTATGTAIGDFDKAIKVEVDSEGTHMTSNLKYLGPCPADRKAGDVVIPGGRVVNIKDLPH
ncbi:DUF3617 family protein [Enhydrobacter sp.]|uniref:DUF3617 domain-containing protein n=1 Tax=Enhydrobacter sp. TaxID=1894999 RepID=UPI00260EC274|nr:DUF3617 family protein [Enhydrobacter sp.]WIM10372.1 MAG: hypothetical protein OJF58_001327 [Enhydrobacter sp.]